MGGFRCKIFLNYENIGLVGKKTCFEYERMHN